MKSFEFYNLKLPFMKRVFTILIPLLSLLIAGESNSQTNNWTGATSTSWTVAGNWSLGHVPLVTENVVIPSAPANQPLISGTTSPVCNNLTINTGAILTISGTTLNNAQVAASGTTTINGTLSIGGSATKTGKLVTANIVWNSGSAIAAYVNSRMEVSGNWDFATGSAIAMGFCSVTFTGNTHSNIVSKSAGSGFGSITLNKTAGYNLYIAATSTATLNLTGSLTLNSGMVLYGEAAITTVIAGNINNSGHFYFNAGTVSLERSSGTQNIQINTGDYFNALKINGGGTVIITNHIIIHDDFTLQSGTFDPANYTMSVGGDWINTAGPGAFIEGTGKVIFLYIINKDGGKAYDHYCNNSENFNILEMRNEGGGFLIINSLGTIITCNQYDWTSGGIKVQQGTFTANDLADAGLFGNYYVQTGGTVNVTNSDSYVDLSGNINMSGGTMNVYGGIDQSYWPNNNTANITMSGGTLNFADQGIRVQSSTTVLNSNITGGTIKTSKNFGNYRTDFNPTGGTIELYGTTDATLTVQAGSLKHLKINKSLSDDRAGLVTLNSNAVINGMITIQSGTIKATNKIISAGDHVNVNSGGTLWLETGTQLKMTGAKALTVNTGGTFQVLGTSASQCLITRNGATSNHEFHVYGTIAAKEAIFEYNYGINIWGSATVDGTNSFNQCTFRNGTDRFLLFANNQELTIRDANFPTVPIAENVWKNNDAGRITFKDAIGAYAGAAYETDPYNRIDWIASQPGLWTGAVSGSWFLPENWDYPMVPDENTHVTIPATASNMPILTSGVPECNNLTIHGLLTISSPDVSVHGNLTVNGTLAMNHASGRLFVYGDVIWNSGSTADFTANATILAEGSWYFNSGSTAALANGTVMFTGTATKYIRSYSTGSSFYHLSCQKAGPALTGFSASSTQPLVVNGNFTTISGSKFVSYSSQDIVLKGNLNSFGTFQCTDGAFKLDGENQGLTMNTNDYFNDLIFSQTGTISVIIANTNEIHVTDDVQIQSGQFVLGNNILFVGGNWSNPAGSAAFSEISSRVIFNGDGNVQRIENSENFWTMELDKSSGILEINPGTSVFCQYYDWTSGSLNAGSGNFTAPNLTDGGVEGNISVFEGGTITMGNTTHSASLKGMVYVYGGTFNLVTSGNSIWPGDNSAALIMTGGVLDVYPGGIEISNDPPSLFSANITGGTIRSQGSLYINRSDFTPSAGTIELYGPNNVIFSPNPSPVSTLRNILINKTSDADSYAVVDLTQALLVAGILDIQSGQLNLGSEKAIFIVNDLNVQGDGKFSMEAGSGLIMYDESHITVERYGVFEALGTTAQPIIIDNIADGEYYFQVSGTLSARHTTFDHNYGIYISQTGIVDPENSFSFCTFLNTIGPYLMINNYQEITIEGAYFPWINSGGNVSKTFDAGHITMLNAWGAGAGEEWETDPFNRIDWFFPQPGLWTGTVSNSWFDPLNWDDEKVPGDTTDVTIPAGTPFSPVISGTSTALCKNLTVDGGDLTLQGPMFVSGNINISDGSLAVQSGNIIMVVGDVDVNAGGWLTFEPNTAFGLYPNAQVYIHTGGTFSAHGTSEAPVQVDQPSFGYYNFDVAGTISASYVSFNRCFNLIVGPDGHIDPEYAFTGCSFSNGVGPLLNINNSQNIILRQVNFPFHPGAANVRKLNDAGYVIMKDATGAGAGAQYEYDPYNRIEWSATQPGLWNGIVSSDWDDPMNWDDLTVPGAATNVTIPAVAFNMPVISSNAECNYLQLDGTLTIGIAELTTHGDVYIIGTVAMNHVLSRLTIIGTVHWNEGASEDITANSTITVWGKWYMEPGASFTPETGTVSFTGPAGSVLRIQSDNCWFYNLQVSKYSSTELIFSDLSTQPLVVNNLFRVENASKFYSESNTDIILRGNLICSGTFQCNAGTFQFDGGSQFMALNNNDYFNHLVFSQSGVVTFQPTYSGAITIKGDLHFDSGSFNPEEAVIYIGGNWDNNLGPDAFDEYNGMVVFNGGNYNQYCWNNEIFNILKVDKPLGGALRISTAIVECTSYEWSGGALDVLGGSSFTAYDLANDGIAGNYFINPGATLNLHQDNVQTVDLIGSLTFTNGGTINIYGGSNVSEWPRGVTSSITMNAGTLNFADQGIWIANSQLPFPTNITGGTIKTTGIFYNFRDDFAPAGGNVELYGETDVVLDMEASALYGLTINKTTSTDNLHRVNLLTDLTVNGPLIIEEGELLMLNNTENQTLKTSEEVTIQNGGLLSLLSGAQLQMTGGKSFTIEEGGTLSAIGSETRYSMITRKGSSSNHEFQVNGNISARNAIFEYNYGLNLWSTSVVDPANSFDRCIFRNGVDRLMIFANSQDIIIQNAEFPTAALYHNVWKTNDAGSVIFRDATGIFAGEDYDQDPNERVFWMGQPGSHTISIPAGWSGLSTYMVPAPENDLADIFNPVMDDFTILMNNSGMFYPEAGILTLQHWTSQAAFKTKMENPVDITLEGGWENDKTVNLSGGWNLMPVIFNDVWDAPIAAMQLGSNLVMIKEVAGPKVYWPQYGIQTLYWLEPGNAYYIRLTQPDTLTFPPNDVKAGFKTVIEHQELISPWGKITRTGSTHIVGIPGELTNAWLTGDIIGVFTAEGICAGFATVKEPGSGVAIAVFADDPSTREKDGLSDNEWMNFRLYRNYTAETIDLEVIFDPTAPDQAYYTQEGISVVAAFKESAFGISEEELCITIYPNPTSDVVNILVNNSILTLRSLKSLKIVSQDGATVTTSFTLAGNTAQLDLTGFPAGIYYLNLIFDDRLVIRKIVKR